MFVASRVDYHIFADRRVVYLLAAGCLVLLAAVFVFPRINGARRWIRLGGFSFQPSELAKIVFPVFLAYFLTKNQERVG
jgi:cell division protein FtsW